MREYIRDISIADARALMSALHSTRPQDRQWIGRDGRIGPSALVALEAFAGDRPVNHRDFNISMSATELNTRWQELLKNPRVRGLFDELQIPIPGTPPTAGTAEAPPPSTPAAPTAEEIRAFRERLGLPLDATTMPTADEVNRALGLVESDNIRSGARRDGMPTADEISEAITGIRRRLGLPVDGPGGRNMPQPAEAMEALNRMAREIDRISRPLDANDRDFGLGAVLRPYLTSARDQIRDGVGIGQALSASVAAEVIERYNGLLSRYPPPPTPPPQAASQPGGP
jgi:hypothetical protein